jgi:YHS domain-containing protein
MKHSFNKGGSMTKISRMVASCAALMIAATAFGQGGTADKPDAANALVTKKQLKPQTTCPVMGEPIDKNLYVDYNGKRIYVCCANCIDKVKKNPEKYIKKLESTGQSVEIIETASKKENKEATADTSMKVKGMKMPGDTAAKTAQTGYWTCPMHPEIHQAASGSCPICGMNLVFKKSEKETTKMKSMDHSKMKM